MCAVCCVMYVCCALCVGIVCGSLCAGRCWRCDVYCVMVGGGCVLCVCDSCRLMQCVCGGVAV